MRRVLSNLIFLAVVLALLYLCWQWLGPQLQQARRYQELLSAPAPTAHTLPNPLPGRALVDTWGGARSEGRRHEGIDIFAPRDTPVRATTRGMISRIGPDRLGGRTVTVLGPAGYRHYYAHLERYPNLQRGEWIAAGDVVGYVGNSGNAARTPPHLHYGIYVLGRAINPYPLLKR